MEILKIVLPLLFAGGLCVLMVFLAKKKSNQSPSEENYQGEGIALGLALGASLSVLLEINTAYPLGLCMFEGFLIGGRIKK